MRKWTIFDLDGTLADIGHRLHFIKAQSIIEEHEFKADWDSFNKSCTKDKPKYDIVHLARLVKHAERNIAIFSGRDSTYKDLTIDWLKFHAIPYDEIYMRKPKDYRSDDIIKRELFEAIFKPEDIWFVVDDRDKVVQMWRSLGITCLQCQRGEY